MRASAPWNPWCKEISRSRHVDYIQEHQIYRLLRRALFFALFVGGIVLSCYAILKIGR